MATRYKRANSEAHAAAQERLGSALVITTVLFYEISREKHTSSAWVGSILKEISETGKLGNLPVAVEDYKGKYIIYVNRPDDEQEVTKKRESLRNQIDMEWKETGQETTEFKRKLGIFPFGRERRG